MPDPMNPDIKKLLQPILDQAGAVDLEVVISLRTEITKLKAQLAQSHRIHRETQNQLNSAKEKAREAHVLMKAGAVDALSIGFRIPKNGATFDADSGIRTISKIDLMEISVVTFPANPKARINAVKSVTTIREFENWLRDVGGYSADQAKLIASNGYKSIVTRDEDIEGRDELADLFKQRSALMQP